MSKASHTITLHIRRLSHEELEIFWPKWKPRDLIESQWKNWAQNRVETKHRITRNLAWKNIKVFHFSVVKMRKICGFHIFVQKSYKKFSNYLKYLPEVGVAQIKNSKLKIVLKIAWIEKFNA